MNETIGEIGLALTGLIFGLIPWFPVIITDITSRKERMKILGASYTEEKAIIAEGKIMTAITRNNSRAAGRSYKLGKKC